jgi:Lon protease-like protein
VSDPRVVTPMFPLGSVLLPSMLLPLRVFEPRYQQLTRDCLAGDRRFGVVLIERGSEVGGGDVRCSVGCLASIIRAEELGGGQWFLLTVGTTRIRILEWLPDDPYPRAVAEEWPDPDTVSSEVCASLERRVRQLLALASELDQWSVPATVELSEDPNLAIHQMAAVAPMGPFDRQRLLAAPSAGARAALLEELVGDTEALLRARLTGG